MKKFILFFCAAFIATLGMFADTVVLSHAAGGSTANLTGENDAAQFGLNAAEWSVVSDLSAANKKRVGLHRDGYIVLYDDNHLTISNLKGKVITSIALDVQSGTSEVLVNGQAVAGVDNVYEVGAGEVVLHNPDVSKKLNLNSITVNYETPGNPLVCSDVVDGGTYAIVNFQPTGAMYYLESVDGVLTAQNGEGIDGDTQWAASCQYKAIELEDGRFAFQNVATGDYLAWRNHDGQGGNGNTGFNPEINEMSSWTMNDGTQVPDYRTYWFYTNWRSESKKTTGSLILTNAGGWNGWGNTECTLADYSNNYGFVAVPTEVDFTKVNISAINQVDFVEAGKWYLLKQKRGGVSAVYDAGEGATMKRAANDEAVVAGMDAAEAVDYLLQFIPTENEGAYNLQFANGRYWANTMTTSSEEVGEYNVYNINGEAGHIGINKFNMENIVDNNGAGNTLAFWASGEVQELNGNNDWTVWEVEFAPKTTAAADLKALIAELEAAYAANNVAELGKNLIIENSQFSSPYTEPSEGSIENLLDGDCATFWHSVWSATNGAAVVGEDGTSVHVHYLQVDLPEAVTGDLQVTLGRRMDKGGFCANDNVVLLGVEASADGENYAAVGQLPMPLVNGEWYETGVVAVEGVKSFRFFNDESNGTGQRGYWHAGEFQLNLVVTPALNNKYPEAAAALLEALAAAKAVGASATEADIEALQAAYDAYVAALSATPEPEALTFQFTDNEDGTITITPSDNERTYFFTIFSDEINKIYDYESDEAGVVEDAENYITDAALEVHKGVVTIDPVEWVEYWFEGAYEYVSDEYRLLAIEVVAEGEGYKAVGEAGKHTYTYTAPAPEPAFPKAGVAYTVKNLDSQLFLQLLDDPENNVTLAEVADKIYFNAVEGGYTISNEAGYVMGLKKVFETVPNVNSWKWCIANSDEALVWELVEVEGGYAFKGDQGHLGFDTAAAGMKAYRNKDYAANHGVFEIVEYVEETFPAAGVAYKIKNVDSELYVQLIDDADQNVTLGANPQEIYFTEVEGGYTISNAAGYVMGEHAKGWNIANTATPIVWTIEEVEGGYAFHNANGYLGYDTAAAGMKAFRNKNYAANHGVFNVWKFDEEEPQPIVPDATLEEIWENIHTLLAEAEAIKALNEVTVTYDGDGYFEDFTSPIVGKVGYKKHDVVWAVCDGADYVNSFVSFFNTAAEAEEYLSEFGGLAALEDILKNVIADYNDAEVVLPTPGKTYIIRNYPYTYTDDFSYAYYYNGEKLALSESANATTAEYMWTVSEPVTYTYFDNNLDEQSDVRYQFVNAADNSLYMSWRGIGADNYAGVTTNPADANSKWYLTGKKVDGTAAPVYGTIALRTYADNNQYRTAVVDMRKSTDHLGKSNGDHFDATYCSWFIFEETEIPVTEWDGKAPVVEVADDTTVKVTFNDAASVEGTNYGVLGAIFDEQDDVVSILFDALFDNSVEYGKDCATLHFKKVAELNAELAASAKNVAAKALAAVGGEAKGKVVILGKSFKIDGASIYQDAIVADFSFGGTQTGINAATLAGQNNIFDLNGRRVRQAKNGLFLLDGKKVVK